MKGPSYLKKMAAGMKKKPGSKTKKRTGMKGK